MKKLIKSSIAVLAAVSITLVGCKKEETSNKSSDNNGSVPSSFTKKVLIEEFTGAWCGWCVDGHLRVDNMMMANGSKIVPVMIHSGDGMEIPEMKGYYGPTFSVTGYPTGMINRVKGSDGKVPQSRSIWEAMAATEMGKTAKLGLSIDAKSVEGNFITAKVTVGYAADVTEANNVVIALVEDKVVGTGTPFDQKNFYAGNSTYSTHPFYSKPATITGYEHKYVLRKMISPSAGEKIDAAKTVKGGSYTKELMLDMTGANQANCYVVAWVHTPGGVVENAQMVKVGESKSFD